MELEEVGTLWSRKYHFMPYVLSLATFLIITLVMGLAGAALVSGSPALQPAGSGSAQAAAGPAASSEVGGSDARALRLTVSKHTAYQRQLAFRIAMLASGFLLLLYSLHVLYARKERLGPKYWRRTWQAAVVTGVLLGAFFLSFAHWPRANPWLGTTGAMLYELETAGMSKDRRAAVDAGKSAPELTGEELCKVKRALLVTPSRFRVSVAVAWAVFFGILAVPALAVGATLAGRREAEDLRDSVRRLHVLLYFLTAALAFGVLSYHEMVTRLAMALGGQLSGAGDADIGGGHFVASTTFVIGVSLSALLAATYIPAAILLNGRLLEFAANRDDESDDSDEGEAKASTPTPISPLGMALRFMVTAIPALAGLLGYTA